MRLRKIVTTLSSILLASALVLLGASAARAHSDTFSSIPAAGSTSATVTQIQFTFAEPVQKTMNPEVVLTASGGINVPVSAPTFDVTGATMTVAIPSGALPNGSYGAVYRVVSIDGHVASGVLNFTVAGSSASSVNSPAATATSVTVPNDLSAASTGGIWSAFIPLVISIVAIIPLIVLAVILILMARRRDRRGK